LRVYLVYRKWDDAFDPADYEERLAIVMNIDPNIQKDRQDAVLSHQS
jgi:hypothetical protein